MNQNDIIKLFIVLYKCFLFSNFYIRYNVFKLCKFFTIKITCRFSSFNCPFAIQTIVNPITNNEKIIFIEYIFRKLMKLKWCKFTDFASLYTYEIPTEKLKKKKHCNIYQVKFNLLILGNTRAIICYKFQ